MKDFKTLSLALLLAIVCALPLSLVTAQALQAESLHLEDTYIELKVPTGWTKVYTGRREIMLRSADQKMAVILNILEPARSAGMMDRLMNVLKSKMRNVQVYPAMEVGVKFKDYPASFVAGNGQLGGEQVEWECALLEMEKTMIVLSWAEPGVSKRSKTDFNQLLQSLKPQKVKPL